MRCKDKVRMVSVSMQCTWWFSEIVGFSYGRLADKDASVSSEALPPDPTLLYPRAIWLF